MKHDQIPSLFPFTAYCEGGDYTVEEWLILEYSLSEGASVKTFVARCPEGQSYRTGIDYFRLTRGEVEREIHQQLNLEVGCLYTRKHAIDDEIERLTNHPLYEERAAWT